MALDEGTKSSEPKSPEIAKVKKYSSQTALAMELPFTIVGAVLLGGGLGYLSGSLAAHEIDFHTHPGRAGICRRTQEVLRRLAQSDS